MMNCPDYSIIPPIIHKPGRLIHQRGARIHTCRYPREADGRRERREGGREAGRKRNGGRHILLVSQAHDGTVYFVLLS